MKIYSTLDSDVEFTVKELIPAPERTFAVYKEEDGTFVKTKVAYLAVCEDTEGFMHVEPLCISINTMEGKYGLLSTAECSNFVMIISEDVWIPVTGKDLEMAAYESKR